METISYEWDVPSTFRGGTVNGFIRFLVESDPKRPGLLKMSMRYSVDGYKTKHSVAYGKKNQQGIMDDLKKAGFNIQ